MRFNFPTTTASLAAMIRPLKSCLLASTLATRHHPHGLDDPQPVVDFILRAFHLPAQK